MTIEGEAIIEGVIVNVCREGHVHATIYYTEDDNPRMLTAEFDTVEQALKHSLDRINEYKSKVH